MALACGKALKETPMLVSGNSVRLMDMVFIHGSMEIDIKVNSRIVSNTDKVSKNSPMEIYTRVSILKVNLQALVNIIGQMAAILKVHLEWVYDVVMEYGRKVLVITINMRVNMSMTKNQATVYSHGRVAMFIKGITKTTRGTVMDKCTGWMEVFTKVNGRMAYNMEKEKFTCQERV